MIRQRGASKLEFAVVVAVFGVLAALLLQRLAAIEEEAERTEVDLTIRNIRVGIQLAIGERIMRGEEHRLIEVAEANPVDLLGKRPRGFVDGPAATAAGEWAWDPLRRELSYMPRLPAAFDGAATLHWRFAARSDTGGKVVGLALIATN